MASSENSKCEELNPLIIKWLTEWRNQAKACGSKMEFVYGKALKSIREHPETLNSGKDCKVLKGFGDKICNQIDKKFAKHFNREPISLPICKNKTPQKNITDHYSVIAHKRTIEKSPSALTKVTKLNQRYIPSKGSSSFAILVALLRYELEFSNTKVNKLDLNQMAQLYATNTIGFNCLKTLMSRELVQKTQDRNARYFLTENGRKLAKNLVLSCSDLQEFSDRFLKISDNNTISNDKSILNEQTNQYQSYILEAGSYEIILCIDIRERYSNDQGNQNRAAFASALQKKGIKIEIRTLPLGDFVWIARKKCQQNSINFTNNFRHELVLDYIIERKRIDDLASSIKDRRWSEQKFRLKNCGLRRPIYLVEYFGRQTKKGDYGGLTSASLDQAIFNCEIDGFEIKRCDNFDETIRYLANMTRWLELFYSNKSIISCKDKESLEKTCAQDLNYITFNEFCTNSTKIQIFTAKEMFIKHLLQIKGLSIDKINVIVKQYPTYQSLIQAYSLLTNDKAKLNLLTDIKSDSILGSNRRLGPAISKKLYQHYCN